MTSKISRRDAVAILAALPTASFGAPPKSSKTWKVCQTTALSGPISDLGIAIHQGAVVGFNEVNARGGVHGKRVELVTMDDAYDVQKALVLVKEFLQDEELFCLFNCMGTPQIGAMLPLC